jgi:hypothetical protein
MQVILRRVAGDWKDKTLARWGERRSVVRKGKTATRERRIKEREGSEKEREESE